MAGTAMFSAISGLKNHQTWMDVIGNNISNVNTIGFKYGRVTFRSMFSQTLGAASGDNAGTNMGGVNPVQVGLGMALSSIDTIMAQGALQTTGNPLDVALQGDGMFMVKSGTSTTFTRAGDFSRDSAGNLVTPEGQLVQGWMARYQLTPGGANPGPAFAPQGGQVITGWQPPDPNSPIGNITIQTGLTLAAKATDTIHMAGNLDAMTPTNPAAAYLNAGGVPHCANAVGGVVPPAQWKPDSVVSTTIYDSLGNPIKLRTEFYQMAGTPTSGGAAAAAWNYYTFAETTQGLVFVGNLWPTPAGGNPNGPIPGQIGGIQPNNEPQGFAGQIGFNSDGSVKYNVALGGLSAMCSAMGSARGLAGGGLVGPYTAPPGPPLGGTTWVPAANMDQVALQIPLWTPNQPPAGSIGVGEAPAGITIDPQTGATLSTSPLRILNWAANFNGGVGTAFGTVSWNDNGLPPAQFNHLQNNGVRDGLTGDVTGAYQVINGVPTWVPNQTAYTKDQDGYPEGTLTGLSVDPTGTIQGGFDNGQTIPIGQIGVVQFANMQGLAQVGSTDFAQTVDSGLPVVGTAGQHGTGSTVGGALEQSNVDLAQELTNMIIAQQGFNANSRIISTSNQMLSTLTGLGTGAAPVG